MNGPRPERSGEFQPAATAPGYEVADVPVRGAVFGLLGVFALIAASAGLVLAIFAGLAAADRPRALSVLERSPQIPPAPRLQAAPRNELAAVRAAAQARLEGYGWADRSAGLAHIPIDRAMQLQAQRGWPDQQREAR